MPSVPRIVTVDPTFNVARIVRGALTLMDRPHILIEAPSSEDALAEVASSSIDLVVTAYQIPGEIDGLELARRISYESLGSPVIVLADADDPQPDPDELEEATYQYFVRPIGEPFIRGIRIALDGEATVEAQASQSEAGLDLGPVPPIDVDKFRDIVVPLVRDVGAMAVIMSDRTGRVLIEHGATGYIDRETLAATLGPAFARAYEINGLVGGDAWAMHYYDGERLDVFGLALGIHYFICLIFDGSNRGAFGSVVRFGRQAADQMIGMIGDSAYSIKRGEPTPADKPKKKKKRKTQETEPVVPAEPVAESVDDLAALLDAPPSEPMLEPVADFDPDALFGQSIDEENLDDLFDPDALGDLAASLSAQEENRVGYDDAIDMGILDE